MVVPSPFLDAPVFLNLELVASSHIYLGYLGPLGLCSKWLVTAIEKEVNEAH